MIAATWPRADRSIARLLLLDRGLGTLEDRRAHELPALLRPGDLLVSNDAATLPASLRGNAEGCGLIELRLLGENTDGTWNAVAFSNGSWRVPTERRPAPCPLPSGTRLTLGSLDAWVSAVSPVSPRLLVVQFEQAGAAFWSALYHSGKPVQYAYVNGELELWHVQNRYATRPWAVEAPSAGFILTGQVLAALRERGVQLSALTHAAGLSATGDATIDAALPLGERYDIPDACIAAIRAARANGGRVIAVGTSVVRALESRALDGHGVLEPGPGFTQLRLGPGFRPRVVDGLLSGVHDPSQSHYALLQAFATRSQLEAATRAAEAWGYLEHEFGDVCLIL
jgi:S-adenosylmethionine:tRNA ribosyltransferase-isomerase